MESKRVPGPWLAAGLGSVLVGGLLVLASPEAQPTPTAGGPVDGQDLHGQLVADVAEVVAAERGETAAQPRLQTDPFPDAGPRTSGIAFFAKGRGRAVDVEYSVLAPSWTTEDILGREEPESTVERRVGRTDARGAWTIRSDDLPAAAGEGGIVEILFRLAPHLCVVHEVHVGVADQVTELPPLGRVRIRCLDAPAEVARWHCSIQPLGDGSRPSAGHARSLLARRSIANGLRRTLLEKSCKLEEHPSVRMEFEVFEGAQYAIQPQVWGYHLDRDIAYVDGSTTLSVRVMDSLPGLRVFVRDGRGDVVPSATGTAVVADNEVPGVWGLRDGVTLIDGEIPDRGEVLVLLDDGRMLQGAYDRGVRRQLDLYLASALAPVEMRVDGPVGLAVLQGKDSRYHFLREDPLLVSRGGGLRRPRERTLALQPGLVDWSRCWIFGSGGRMTTFEAGAPPRLVFVAGMDWERPLAQYWSRGRYGDVRIQYSLQAQLPGMRRDRLWFTFAHGEGGLEDVVRVPLKRRTEVRYRICGIILRGTSAEMLPPREL